MSYMTVETTNLTGCACFSFQCDDHDIPNGAVVGRGDLVEGETEIYEAVDLTKSNYKNGLFLVANPAWNYDNSSATAQNEENYVNVKGKPFRVYELLPHRKFKIGNIENHTEQGFDEDKFITFEINTGKYKKDDTAKAGLRIVRIEETGFPYCIGSAGTKLGDSDDKYGYVLDLRNTKYTIEYIPADTSGSGE